MTTPSTTVEVSTVAVGASNGVITIGLTAIKSGTIDGTSVVMTPTAGATAIVWANTCTSTEAVVKNFFKC